MGRSAQPDAYQPTTKSSVDSTGSVRSRSLAMLGEHRDRDSAELANDATERALQPRNPRRTAAVLGSTLVHAAPLGLALHVVILVAMSAGPAVLAVQTGSIVAQALDGNGLSPYIALGPLIVLSLTGAAAAVDRFVQFLVGERYTAAVEERVMASVISLPSLALFEDPKFADRLEITRWTAGGDFSGGGGAARLYMDAAILLRTGVAVVAAATVTSRLGLWVPWAILLPVVPTGVMAWHAGAAHAVAERVGGVERRRSDWFLDLGLSIDGGKEVRLFGLADWVRRNHHEAWVRGFEGVSSILRRQARREVLVAVAGAVAIVTVFVSSAARADSGDVATSDLVAGVLAIPLLAAAARSLAAAPGDFRYRLGNLPAVAALLDLHPPSPSGDQAAPRAQASIVFDNVTFRYPGTKAPIIRDLSLTIGAGECVALVGRNGCGKSTLVKLLCRLYDIEAGVITLNGVDIRDIDLRQLRRTVAVLFQEPVHYPFSLARNVAPSLSATAASVDRAVDLAGASRVAEALPSGAATTLGREWGGEELSGGEWQRIALARALAAADTNDSAILIADEPTSQMDVRIEHDLNERFAEVKAGRTALLISHRYSTVRMADRIAVMHDGGIAEVGTHEELLHLNGTYAELYRLQAASFERGGDE